MNNKENVVNIYNYVVSSHDNEEALGIGDDGLEGSMLTE